MALHKLFVDDLYDDAYKLIAVHCRLEDYRLAYLLNKNLDLNLTRSENDLDFKYLASSYSFFEWNNEAEYVTWNLVSNVCKKEEDSLYSTGTLFTTNEKTLKTFHLIPELKRVDYFIKISNEIQNINEDLIVSKLQAIPQIITIYTVNPLKIKSKDHLIFESMPNKKTKIVATLGPATSTKKVLKAMLDEGCNVFRINFSHADYKDVEERIKMIRELNEEFGYNASILGDLQGPKLRVGVMKGEVIVDEGDEIIFATGERFEGTKERVYMTYDKFPQDAKPGERILLDDGKLIFEVVSTDKKTEVKAKVIQGGPLKSKKGVNLPNTNISQPALTEKDIEDAIFAIGQKVDWMALSFVRHAEDLMQLEKLISEHSEHKIPIIAKIEKPEAVENIDKIVAYCDGLMVARGDLGVEIPAEEVPLIQKQLVLRAKRARIPVIIATQMMETMITSLTPTRAEVNDVANSVMDGADAVMLSGETSVGKYPVQVIRQMANIIRSVEDSPLIKVPQSPPHIRTKRYITKAICFHAANMANEINATAISTLTNSGYTAFQISAWRPSAHILVFTSNKRILTQLSLLWGVKAFYYDKYVTTDETLEDVNAIACKMGYLEVGDMLISLAAMPIQAKGMVNTLRVTEIESCSF